MIPSDELTGTDQVQARLEGMRAEFRAAQQRRYEKVAITAANNTESATSLADQTTPAGDSVESLTRPRRPSS